MEALIQGVYAEVFCDTDKAAEQADLAKVGSQLLKSGGQLTGTAPGCRFKSCRARAAL